MPVVFPTPEELERAPWRVQQAARDRLAEYKKELQLLKTYMDEIVDAQFQSRKERLDREIREAQGAVIRAREILLELKADDPVSIAERRRVAIEAIYGRSA